MFSQIFHFALVAIVFVLIVGGILVTPLTFPGTWVVAAAGILYAFFAPFDGGSTSAFWVIAWLLGLAAFGEIMEFAVGTLGGKAVQVSTGAIVAAFIGGLVGLIVGVPVFLVGSLIGLYLGAFLGAFLYEMILLKSLPLAFKTAATVLATRMMASFLKTCLAIGMGIFLAFKMF